MVMQDLDAAIDRVLDSKTSNFLELLRVAELDPKIDLRYRNWAGLDLSKLDLRGFDFTGADLSNTRFENSLISGAVFKGASYDPMELRKAADYSEKRISSVLLAYQLLSSLAAPFSHLLLAQRLKRGRENSDRLDERLGESLRVRPEGTLIWLHAPGVSELASALSLIQRIAERNFNILVTTSTVTSSELADQRLPRGVTHQFLPLDARRFMRRFLERWQPDLALFVESNLFPNMIIETSRRSVPMILINGRVSDNSFKRLLYLPKTIGVLLRRFDLCLAATAADAMRLADLGARRVVTSGNLKLDVPLQPVDATKLRELSDAISFRPLIAAAQTHTGEDVLIVRAHNRLCANFPGMLTFITPRHPERGIDIAEIAQSVGLNVSLRSRHDPLHPNTDIYVFDTIGELGLVYQLAPILFIGGSLVRHGGQSPIEPAKSGAAIVHGPYTWNFAEIYDALDRNGGGQSVTDGNQLATVMGTLLSDQQACARAADASRTVIETIGGALERTLNELEPYLAYLEDNGSKRNLQSLALGA